MSAGTRGSAPHLFTVDVEEYFHVHAFRDLVQPGEWECFPSRVERSCDELLAMLDEHGATATFFVLGWLAERRPELVRRIAAAGHEVASHSWWHRPVTELSPDAFRADARDAKALLEDLTGERVDGYRAPGFSLVPETEWMLEILVEEGYRYDSSLYPCRTLGSYQYPGAARRPHRVETPAGSIVELPVTTLRRIGLTLPAAGGAYLRHFPLTLVRAGLDQAAREGEPGVFYIHPWELDPHQPVLPVSPTTRLRHYGHLARTAGRLERLLGTYRFASVRDRYGLPSALPDEGSAPEAPRYSRPRRAHG